MWAFLGGTGNTTQPVLTQNAAVAPAASASAFQVEVTTNGADCLHRALKSARVLLDQKKYGFADAFGFRGYTLRGRATSKGEIMVEIRHAGLDRPVFRHFGTKEVGFLTGENVNMRSIQNHASSMLPVDPKRLQSVGVTVKDDGLLEADDPVVRRIEDEESDLGYDMDDPNKRVKLRKERD